MSGLDNTAETFVKTPFTGTYVVTQNDYDVMCLALTGALAVTLPAGSAVQPGRTYRILKDASAQTVTIAPASGTIDGGANITLATGAKHGVIVITDGANWFTVVSS